MNYITYKDFLNSMQRPSNTELNKLGERLKNNIRDSEAFEKVSAWRTLHILPLQHFRRSLYRRIMYDNPSVKKRGSISVQRLKRMPTIVDKLIRFSSTSLARMQDIGGIRAILDDINKVRLLENRCKKSTSAYKVVRHKDYIKNPKNSGYRGIHLIYKYKNTEPQYNDLAIELQIRTKLQHIWATAVEMAGIFQNEDLKSSIGNSEWLNFFAITSSAFACIEKQPILTEHSNLTEQEIFNEVINKANHLKVKEVFNGLTQGLQLIKKVKTKSSYAYYIIKLSPSLGGTSTTEILPYQRLDEATQAYQKLEADIFDNKQIQVVMVSGGKIENLKNMYQNFFLDTADFLKELTKIENLIIT